MGAGGVGRTPFTTPDENCLVHLHYSSDEFPVWLGHRPPEIWAIPLAAMLLLYGAAMCVAIVELFMPGPRASLEVPDAASRLRKELKWPLLVTTFGLFATWGVLLAINPAESQARSLGASLALLLISSVWVGGVALRRLNRDDRPGSATNPLTRMMRWSPAWVALGTVAEAYRGAWIVWVLSALGVLSVMFWSDRAASKQGVQVQ